MRDTASITKNLYDFIDSRRNSARVPCDRAPILSEDENVQKKVQFVCCAAKVASSLSSSSPASSLCIN